MNILSRKFNQHSLEWKLAVLLTIRLAYSTLTFGQETADKVFNWNQGGQDFWRKAINCGKASQPGGANNTRGVRVQFGTQREIRFPGTYSVELWTNANYEERCNQNFSAERAEISAYGKYRGMGVKEGATLWMGWSEKWTELDESHTTTMLQFRSNCGAGSPATQINLLAGRRLQVRTRNNAKFADIGTIKEDVWYDFVVEIKYSKRNDGYIKVWMYEANNSPDPKYSYNDRPSAVINGPTMLGGDNCPHIRWGVYRHQSGDKRPGQIRPQDRLVVRYLGPSRFKIGNNLAGRGFAAVVPRKPGTRVIPPPVVIEDDKEEEEKVETPPPPPVQEEIPVETTRDLPCGEGENVALGKSTKQSSKYGYGTSGRAVDEDLSTDRGPWTNGSITHTRKDKNAWWEIDLGEVYTISEITYKGRTDCCKDRLSNAYVLVSEKPFISKKLDPNLKAPGVWNHFSSKYPDPKIKVEMEPVAGRYVRIQLKGTNFLSLADVQIFGCPGDQTSDITQGNFLEEIFSDPDIEEAIPIRFYPNQAKDHIFIEMERPAVVRILDYFGKTVKLLELPAGRQRVDLSEMGNGSYLIFRYYGDKFSVGKLIIQR